MTTLIMVIVLGLLIAALASVLVLSQRQFDGGGVADGGPGGSPEPRPAAPGPPPLPPPQFASSGLSLLVASTIERADRSRPQNSHGVAAVAALRVAFDRAVAAEFAAEVRDIVDGISSVLARHDVRRRGDDTASPIDHLIVAPTGVFVVASRIEGDRAVVDRLLDETAAVAAVIKPVPTRALLVVPDGAPEIGAVAVTTPARLVGVLTERGPVADLAVVEAHLATEFKPAMETGRATIGLNGHRAASGADV